MKYKEIFCSVSPSGISILTGEVDTPFVTGKDAINATIAKQGNSLYSIDLARRFRTPIPMHTFYVNLVELLRQLGLEVEWHSTNPDMQGRLYQELISGKDVRLILQKKADEAIGVILIPLDIDSVKNHLESVPTYDFSDGDLNQAYDLVKRHVVYLVDRANKLGGATLTYQFDSKRPEPQAVAIKMKYERQSKPVRALDHMLHNLKISGLEFIEPRLSENTIILDGVIYPTDAWMGDSVFKNHVLSFVNNPVQDNPNLSEIEIMLVKSNI